VKCCALMLTAMACLAAQPAVPPARDAADPYTRGKMELDTSRFAEAEADLAAAERETPGVTNAQALRAKALIHLNRFEEAETCLREYLKREPASADATYLLAYTLFRRNSPKESLDVYTRAARLQRPRADDFKVVGLDYVLLGDYTDAEKWLQRSVVERPDDAEAIYYLGRAYYVENSFDRAISEFNQCLQIDPLHVKAENNLGLAYDAKNRPALAEAAYRKAIDIEARTGQKNAEPYVNLADVLSHSGRNDEALPLLERAEQIGGESGKVAEIRGRVFYAQDRLQDAEAELRTAVAAQPENGSLHFLLGRVLKREGRTADAEAEFRQTQALIDKRSSGQK
jgi:tetratricopeptide (TPR) repeat protein